MRSRRSATATAESICSRLPRPAARLAARSIDENRLGGNAAVTSGLINNAIALEVGGSLLVTGEVGEQLGATLALLSLDDHVLAAVGSGNYGTSVSGAGGNGAVGAGVSNMPVSMNGGNGGNS